MTALWAAIGALTVAALAAIALPLLRRGGDEAVARQEFDIQVYKDQLAEIEREQAAGLLSGADAEAARTEIERRLLAAADAPRTFAASGGRWATLAGLVIIVPLSALLIYGYLGTPDQPDAPYAARDTEREEAERRQAGAGDMTALVERLSEKMKSRPDDLKGWLMLGRSSLSLGRYEAASDAYARAFKLAPERPEVGIDYAESLVLANDGRMTAQAHGILDAAVAADPKNLKGRYYLALAKAQQGDYQAALQDWVDLRHLSAPDAPWRPTLDQQIAYAAKQLQIDETALAPSETVRNLRPPAPGPSAEDVKAAEQMSPEDRMAMIRGMVQRLADRLADEPDDLAGWRRLERAYRVLGETAKADEAKARIKALSASGQ